MITMRRQLLGLGFVAASSLVALHAAHALTGPTAIQIDGGPLGPLQLSGGVDGFAYYLSGTNSNVDFPNSTSPFDKSNGAYVANALVELQKTDGELQFTIEIGSNGSYVLGAKPSQTSISTFTTGPLYAGYLTLAPNAVPGLTISAGQLGSLEGWESGIDWNNSNQLATDIFAVQNSQSRGVEASYTVGPVAATVEFGDGFDDGVFNFVQALATYTINSTNSVSAYYAGNLGRTGLNTITYGNTPTGTFGPNFANSQMIGGWYDYTIGSLNLVPEAQYVVAKADAKLGLAKASSNFGAAVFADYSFGTSPYSVGAWIEYANSNGPDVWFLGTRSELVGFSVAPTWQYKDLFARADVGALYLLNNKDFSTASYGSNGRDKYVATGTLEAGLLF
jgi:hypothetical protein